MCFNPYDLSDHPNDSYHLDQVRGRHGDRWQLQRLRQVCRGFPQAWSLPPGAFQIIGKII